MTSVINARAMLLRDMPNLPPMLYVSPEVGDPVVDAMTEVMLTLGLWPLSGAGSTFRLPPNGAPGWAVLIGADQQLTVLTPSPAGPLVYDITITDPRQWCGIALGKAVCLLVVGPPLPWRRGLSNVAEMLRMLDKRPACYAVVPVQAGSWRPPPTWSDPPSSVHTPTQGHSDDRR